MNPAQILCNARVHGVICLRRDVAEKLLKIVQVDGDHNRGTVGRGDPDSTFQVTTDESMTKDDLSLTIGQPNRDSLPGL